MANLVLDQVKVSGCGRESCNQEALGKGGTHGDPEWRVREQ